MNILIVDPIKRCSRNESQERFEAATDAIKKIFTDAHTTSVMWDNYGDGQSDLLYLGRNVFQLLSVDAVYFLPDWENDQECKLINDICAMYRIQRIEPES